MRVLVIFGHLNIFHEMTAEIEVKCMAVLYLSPDMYLFYKTTNHYRLQYSSTKGNHLSLQNTKLIDFILLRNLYHTFLLCSCPVLALFFPRFALCWSMETCILLERAFQPIYINTFCGKFKCVACLIVAWVTCTAWVARSCFELNWSHCSDLEWVLWQCGSGTGWVEI